MKMKNFYCFIGPKSSVAGGLGGISTQSMTLKNLDSTPTGEKIGQKDNSAQFKYLPELPKNINLER